MITKTENRNIDPDSIRKALIEATLGVSFVPEPALRVWAWPELCGRNVFQLFFWLAANAGLQSDAGRPLCDGDCSGRIEL